MAYMPNHPFVNEVVTVLTDNLKLHPDYLLRMDTPEAEADESTTIRLTGPAMYQFVLHETLEKAKCQKIDDSYCDALMDPEKHCGDGDTGLFQSFFPGGLKVFRRTNFDDTLATKLFYPGSAWVKETDFMNQLNHGAIDYDDPKLALGKPKRRFCDADEFSKRAKTVELKITSQSPARLTHAG